MSATERMMAQAEALRAMLGGTEAGKAMGAPAPMAAPPGRRAAPPGPPAPPGEGHEEPDGDEFEGEGDGDGDGDEPDPNAPEAGKTLQLPEGTDHVTLIDGDQFMKALGDTVRAVVASALEAALAPVHKALDGISDASALQMAGLGEVGKSLGALRAVPAGVPPRPGVAAPNARPGAAAPGPVAARIPGGGRSPFDGLDERLKGMNESERERVIMPMVFRGQIDMHIAQDIVNHGAIPRDANVNAEAVKAALDADAR